MDELYKLENLENYLKQVGFYGEYNYCFTVQPEDTLGDAILMIGFGLIGGLISGSRKAKGTVAYILNKNERGIGIIPIEKENKKAEARIALEKAFFLKDEDIAKVSIKLDTSGKLIRIKTKDKAKYGFKTAVKIKNADYHEANLKSFIKFYK